MEFVSSNQFFLRLSCLLATMVVFADATSVKMDYLPTGFARVDPILRDDCLSDHVRKYSFYQSVM